MPLNNLYFINVIDNKNNKKYAQLFRMFRNILEY